MAVLDRTYFTREPFLIPIDNINVQNYIDFYEQDFLSQILGYELYRNLVIGLNSDPIDQKWVNLKNGCEFLDDTGKLAYFSGIAKIETAYIYAMILRNERTYITSSGIKRGLTENAQDASPRYDFTKAINIVNDLQQQLIKFINAKNNEVPDTYVNFEYKLFSKVNIFNV